MTRTTTLTLAARSDMGRVRTNNEDAFALVDLVNGAALSSGDFATPVLLSLSDGMGGHEAGEVASGLVLQTLTKELTARAEPGDEAFAHAVAAANTAVFAAAHEAKKHGMGATLTAILVADATAWIAEVGDSRAYLSRGGRLRQLTRDQSLVQMLVDHGMMTAEEARDAPQKNVIVQAMGLAAAVQPAIGKLALRRGDRLLLCCDGLSNAITDRELAEIVDSLEPAAACDRLIDLANERGGEDNLTAIVAIVGGAELPEPGADEAITGTFEVVRDFGKRPVASVPPAAPAVVRPAAPAEPVAALAPATRRSIPWIPVAVVMAVVAVLLLLLLR
jgi:PPM family protein phosphatase